MRTEIISTLGGSVGVVTRYLLEGLLKNVDMVVDLVLVDSRMENEIQSHHRLNRKYTPKLKSPLLAKVKSLLDIRFMHSSADLIHCHYSSNAAFLNRPGPKVIVTMHGFPRPEVEATIKDKMAYMFEQWCVSKLGSVEIVTISEYCKSAIKNRYGLDAKVIYNGIDCNYFIPFLKKELLKKRLGFENKKVILFVGRLHPIKDPLTLIEAYKEVSRLIDNTCLIIVGDGPMRETISSQLLKNNISAIVLGNRYGNDLLSLYQCADLFVMPSLGESFGLTLAEAMACGCPCIANKSGALPEILDIEDLLVEPKNVKVLADTMRYVLENPEAASNYSKCLARRIRSTFSVDRMCDEYYRLYKNTHSK